VEPVHDLLGAIVAEGIEVRVVDPSWTDVATRSPGIDASLFWNATSQCTRVPYGLRSRMRRSLHMRTIRPANDDEAETISALAIRSKGHWGYRPEQMSVFARELTICPADVAAGCAHVLEEEGAMVGFYTLIPRSDGSADLEHIFVDPSRLGEGLGTALFRHACTLARIAGYSRLVIHSDPNAVGFYESMGAQFDGYVESSIPGRHIPRFGLDLLRDAAQQAVAADDHLGRSARSVARR
jgi:GNAT superfamily N-acetyltransferase